MFTRTAHPLRSHLLQLLHSELPARDERETAAHLETCADCRRELETLAAPDAWWTEANGFLSDDPDEPSIDLDDRSDDKSRPLAELPVDFLEPSDNPAMIGRLGDYEILEPIGRGGAGIVLKGYDHDLNRFVAVKVLAPHYAHVGAARQRFAREAQAAAAVVHPHVIAIHSVNAVGKLPYLVMPYVAGESLQQRLDREGSLELAVVLRIARQVADGLEAAHAQGLVHRDVKPANILLEKGVDRVVLTDFGLARAADDATLTCSGIIAGTPQYMSPEQARGDSIDHRSDLFSLGSVLYAMCTGRPPFRSETSLGILRRITDDRPRRLRELNPAVPLWLESIVFRLLAKSPSDRFTTAAELSSLLEKCLAHVQSPTTVPLPSELRQGWKKQRLPSWSAAVLVCVMAVAIGGKAVNHFRPAPAMPDERRPDPYPVHMPRPSGTPLTAPLDWISPVADELRDVEDRVRELEQSLTSSSI